MATPDRDHRLPDGEELRARQLDDFWDDLVDGAPPGALDNDLATSVRHVHAIDDARPADPAFLARLRRELVGETATVDAAVELPPATRRLPETAVRVDRGPLPRNLPIRRWATTHLATAALLLLTLGAVAYVLTRVREETHGPGAGPASPAPSPTPVYPCDTVGAPPDGSPVPIDPGTPVGTRLDSRRGLDVNDEAYLLAICLAKRVPFDYGGAMTQNYLKSHFGTTDRAAIAAQLATYPVIDPNSVNDPVFVAAGGRVSIDVFWTRNGQYIRERWYFVWYGSKPMLDDSTPLTADASDPARPAGLADLPGPPP